MSQIRPKPGRPLTGKQKRERCVVWLQRSTREKLSKLGRNLSDGIEKAAQRL